MASHSRCRIDEQRYPLLLACGPRHRRAVRLSTSPSGVDRAFATKIWTSLLSKATTA